VRTCTFKLLVEEAHPAMRHIRWQLCLPDVCR
jgi:hypothetical protein